MEALAGGRPGRPRTRVKLKIACCDRKDPSEVLN